MPERQPLLLEVGNHKQVTSMLHKSVGGGNEGSLLPCVLSNTNQTPVPPGPKQETFRHERQHKASNALRSAKSYTLHEVCSTQP